MADNLLYVGPLPNNLSYKDDFNNLIDKGYGIELINRLTAARRELEKQEEKFYSFYGITGVSGEEAYKELQDKIAECLKEDPEFYKDFYKVTNTNIVDDKDLKRLISQSKTIKKTYFDLSDSDKDKVAEALTDELLLVKKDSDGNRYLTLWATDFYFNRLPISLPRGRGVTLTPQGQVDIGKAKLDIAEEISGAVRDEILKLVREEFLGKGLTAISSTKKESRDFVKKLVAIYDNAREGIEERTFTVELTNKKEQITYIPKKNKLSLAGKALPTQRANKAIIAKTSFSYSLEEGNEDINPVVREKNKSGAQDGWIKSLSDDAIRRLNGFGGVKEINGEKTIYGWLVDKIGLQSSTFSEYFQTKIKQDDKYFIREMVNPSKFIGMLGEDFSYLLLEKLTTRYRGEVEGIGNKGKSKNDLAIVDQFRGGKQPPVDTLVTFYEKTTGYVHYGVQVKHSYQDDAQYSHDVGFLPEKNIDKIFNQDLAELFLESAALKGNNVELSRTNNFVDEFIPLLQEYFGNVTIQHVLKQKLALVPSSFTKEDTQALEERNIESAIQIINKIFSYFLDLSMDLGTYSTANDLLKERNLFVFYLNQYFIPATAIIDWAIESLKTEQYVFLIRPVLPKLTIKTEDENNNKNITLQDKSGLLPELEEHYDQKFALNSSEGKNILSYIKIQGMTRFRQENIEGFNLLAKMN